MKIRGFVSRTSGPRASGTRGALRALLATGAALALLTVAAGPAAAGGATDSRTGHRNVLVSVLLGENETGGGDAEGIGFAVTRVRASAGQICYAVAVARLGSPVTVAHIHRGAAGVAGPVVVPLTAPVDGFARDCATVDPALAAEILAAPHLFYVNVHTSAFPAGAVRGQLHRHRHHR